jgi:hypothetical protein
MDPSIISALAALGGATIGGLTSVVGAWWAQQKQVTAQEFAQDKLRRQELYREFIQDASKSYADGLQNNKPDVSALVEMYTKISRMRVLSSPKVVKNAEQVARAIVNAYMAPNVTVSELRDLMDTGRLDPLRGFSEACRAEFVGHFAAVEAASARDIEAWLKLPQHLRSQISHEQS